MFVQTIKFSNQPNICSFLPGIITTSFPIQTVKMTSLVTINKFSTKNQYDTILQCSTITNKFPSKSKQYIWVYATINNKSILQR
jgi:hypothetical protein